MSNEVIWTNHLKERARERHVDPKLVDLAIRYPDKVEQSRTSSARKHIKYVNGMKIVAAVKKEGNNWIVVSVWQNPIRGNDGQKSYLLADIIFSGLRWLEKIIRGGS